jgi:hypothetical protein
LILLSLFGVYVDKGKDALDPNKNGAANALDPNKNGVANALDPNKNGIKK